MKNRGLGRGADGARATDRGIMPIEAISYGSGGGERKAGKVVEGGNRGGSRRRVKEVCDKGAWLGPHMEHGGVDGANSWGSSGANH